MSSTSRVNLESKINNTSLLTTIFSYVPLKRAVETLRINKKLSTSLNLSIEDYYLDKKYREIIDKSKGSINYIFENSIIPFQKEMLSPTEFIEYASKLIKYLKYLYLKKKFKSFKLEINGNVYNNWFYFQFSIESINILKKGLCLKIIPNLNYKYYDLMKEAIHELEEIKSVDIHSFKGGVEDKIAIDFLELFNWTKVKCINLADCINGHYVFIDHLCNIPKNASFKKLCIDETKVINLKKLYSFLSNYPDQFEHLKILNFSDINYYSEGRDYRLDSDYFEQFTNIKNLKLLQCRHLFIYSFFVLFKSTLSTIKKLILDNLIEHEEKTIFNNQTIESMNRFIHSLSNLEKLDINFNPTYKPNNIFKILSIIIGSNPNLNDIKICIPYERKKEKKKEEKDSDDDNKEDLDINDFNNFINFDSANNKAKKKQIQNNEKKQLIRDNLNEFLNLIKAISSLHKLSSLILKIPMNNKMTKIFNVFFRLKTSLNNLAIIHSGNLDITQLFNNHPNLVNINFTLICEECNIDSEDEGGIKKIKINDFKYDFPVRNWKSIILNYYPINEKFINTLMICRHSLFNLKLNNSINVSQKSNDEIYNILLEITNGIKTQKK